jgi:hypothetical protein
MPWTGCGVYVAGRGAAGAAGLDAGCGLAAAAFLGAGRFAAGFFATVFFAVDAAFFFVFMGRTLQ